MMLISTKHISHLGTVVIENTQSELWTFVKSLKLTSVMINHHQSEKLWFPHAAEWRSKCHPSFPLAIIRVNHTSDETRYCFVLYLKCWRKKIFWRLDVIGGKSQCLRNKKEVRGIKVQNIPLYISLYREKKEKSRCFCQRIEVERGKWWETGNKQEHLRNGQASIHLIREWNNCTGKHIYKLTWNKILFPMIVSRRCSEIDYQLNA